MRKQLTQIPQIAPVEMVRPPGSCVTSVLGSLKPWRGGRLARLGAIGRFCPGRRGPRRLWRWAGPSGGERLVALGPFCALATLREHLDCGWEIHGVPGRRRSESFSLARAFYAWARENVRAYQSFKDSSTNLTFSRRLSVIFFARSIARPAELIVVHSQLRQLTNFSTFVTMVHVGVS